MITDVQTSKGTSAITSDQWHVVHSRLVDADSKRPYVRSIHSEHADRLSCRKAALALRARLDAESAGVPEAERDEVFICRPKFKSLKRARTRRAGAE
ncbi:MAG TPA: hypothetical protein VFT55_03780 [Planctomycetota bacterium]|nr:hypothetical protein [Planctomycetota bacterium]